VDNRHRPIRTVAGFLLTAVWLAGCGEREPEYPVPPAVTVRGFLCDSGLAGRGKWMRDQLVLSVAGRQWTLPRVLAGSGARYFDGETEAWEHQGRLRLTFGEATPATCLLAKQGEENVAVANLASENCARLGGTLKIEQHPIGKVGVCYFADNRQCEEWALFYGACPSGGLKVAGYATEAARFCAIRGGQYEIMAPPTGSTPEAGKCFTSFRTVCNAQALYDGTCR
jgi:putative hemolysin